MNAKTVIVILSVLLVAAIAVIIWLYPLATRPLFAPEDQPLITRTEVLRAKELKGRTIGAFPIVTHRGQRTCVELRTWGQNRLGSFTACYDSGKLIETSLDMGF